MRTAGGTGDADENSFDFPASALSVALPSREVSLRRSRRFWARTARIDCAEANDRLIFQGDIWFEAPPPGPSRSFFGLRVIKPGYSWPGGVIPFQAAGELPPVILRAVEMVHSLTPLRLRAKRPGDAAYVVFQRGNENGSFVGCRGDEQPIGYAGDATPGVLLHEICHAFGLWHEHSRPDRDQFVVVEEANIIDGFRSQFSIVSDNAAPVGPYDYSSIMHYSPDAYAKTGTTTIRSRSGAPIGQRRGLTAGDIAALRAIYPDLRW